MMFASSLPLVLRALAFAVFAAEAPLSDLDLKPCINGAASADGILPSEPDAAASSLATTDLDLEPCMNGAVSASGAFPSQDMEDQINAYARRRYGYLLRSA